MGNRAKLAKLLIAFASTISLGQAVLAGAPAEFTTRADALIRRHVQAESFSGVVIVADHGRPILRRAYGLADREWGARATPDTEFLIGSTTKQLTAAAVMQLAAAGKLGLDDPVDRYVPDLPTAWKPVTVRELLNHSSGIPDYVQVSGFLRGPARLDLAPEKLVDLVRDQALSFSPGTGFLYSNTDYVLLGMIIERTSGQPFGTYLEQHVLRPLGMRHTTYDDPAAIVWRRASGYWKDGTALRKSRPLTTAASFAAGGLRSTADDLLLWDQGLHSGRLLPLASVSAMFTDYGHGYGFGAFVETRTGHRLWDHGGSVAGFACAYDHYPDDGLTIIVLSNIEGGDAEKISAELASMYFRRSSRGAT